MRCAAMQNQHTHFLFQDGTLGLGSEQLPKKEGSIGSMYYKYLGEFVVTQEPSS